jgi:hypothetical protein
LLYFVYVAFLHFTAYASQIHHAIQRNELFPLLYIEGERVELPSVGEEGARFMVENTLLLECNRHNLLIDLFEVKLILLEICVVVCLVSDQEEQVHFVIGG